MPIPLIVSGLLAVAREIAPMLAARVTGSDAAGRATQAVLDGAARATGLDVRTPEQQEAAAARLMEDAEARRRFAIALREAETDVLRLELADRADARARDIDVRGRAENWRANIMLVTAALSLLACLYLAFRYEGGQAQVFLTLITTTAGALLKMLSDAFAFEFGSSRGSKEKDLELARLAEGRGGKHG